MMKEHPEHARIAYSVGRLDRALRRSMGRVTARHGLTVAQYTALSVLSARGRQSNAQLARRSLVSPQAMNEIIEAMAAKRMVVRRPDPLHGRIVQIGLTAKGEAVLARCDEAVQRVEEQMLAGLTESQRRQFQGLLRSCIVALEASAQRERERTVAAVESHAFHHRE
jgi:DNA-binding MarR family transcriptional regulator